MSEDVPPTFPPAPETLRAASRLERHVEWHEGFWLAYVFTSSSLQARYLRERLEAKLRERGRASRVLRPRTPQELETILEDVLAEPRAACTWVEAVAAGAPGTDAAGWIDAWTSFVLRANERRELLRASPGGGLVLVAHPNLKSKLREAGPDLWSVRTFVFELPPSLEEGRDEVVRRFQAARRELLGRAVFVDPVLLESDVRRLPRTLEDLPEAAGAVTQRKLAERLHFVGRYDDAIRAWRESIASFRLLNAQRADELSLELGEAFMGLGDALQSASQHAAAAQAFTEAIALLEKAHGTREHADIAASLHGLANALEAGGHHDEAERAYKESIAIGERVHAGTEESVTAAVRDLTVALASRGVDESDFGERLVDELARICSDPDEARLLVMRAGFPPQQIPAFRTGLTFWSNVVDAAMAGAVSGGVQAIVDAVRTTYPHNAFFAKPEPR